METKHPLSDLTDMLAMSLNVLNSATSNLPEDQKQMFNDELIKQGYDQKMGELKNKMAELNKMSKKF